MADPNEAAPLLKDGITITQHIVYHRNFKAENICFRQYLKIFAKKPSQITTICYCKRTSEH